MNTKKLYRSRTDRKVAGVLGGFAQYFESDATLLRVIFIILLVLTGFFPFGIIYILAWIVMSEEPMTSFNTNPAATGDKDAAQQGM